MTVPKDDLSRTAATADADLILRTRSGDRGAFGELWQRHYPSGMSVARSITSSIDPDDLVQESYTRIYQAIIKGGGPNGSFRAYLFTSIRNTAAAWGRSRRETPIDELDHIADPDSTEDAANEALDRGLTAQAFRSLPARWQEVLWYTEIEQMKPAEVAPLLGMKAGAVSQLAFRAREGLREGWIQAHLRNAGSGSECSWTIEHLGAHSRGNLSTRDQKRLDQHIDNCARCVIVAAEAKDVSGRLALVLLPLVLGVTGASGYVAALQSTAPVPVVAAMPSGVFEGGIVVADGATSTGALGVPLDGGGSGGLVGGAGGAGSGGSGVGGGAITGIGALVGAGSAALVVAGVVAAATIVPGLVNATPATSLPSAGDFGNSSISSEVEPDPDTDADNKFVLEIDAETPKTPDDVDSPPELKAPEVDDNAPATDAAPVAAAPSEEGADGSEPTKPPVEPEKPTDPVEPEPEPAPEPEPEPTLPAGIPTIGTATVTFDLEFKTNYAVPVSGIADASVRAVIGDDPSTTREAILAANDVSTSSAAEKPGSATLDLKPTFDQLCDDAEVDFFYVAGDEIGEAESVALSDLGEFPLPELLELACGLNIDLATAAAASGETSSAAEPAAESAEEPAAETMSTAQPIAEDVAPQAAIGSEPSDEITAEVTSPTEEPVPTAEVTSSTEESAPAEETARAEETAPAEVTSPTEETAPVE